MEAPRGAMYGVDYMTFHGSRNLRSSTSLLYPIDPRKGSSGIAISYFPAVTCQPGQNDGQAETQQFCYIQDLFKDVYSSLAKLKIR